MAVLALICCFTPRKTYSLNLKINKNFKKNFESQFFFTNFKLKKIIQK